MLSAAANANEILATTSKMRKTFLLISVSKTTVVKEPAVTT